MTHEERQLLEMEWRECMAYIFGYDPGGEKYWQKVERSAEIERQIAEGEKEIV